MLDYQYEILFRPKRRGFPLGKEPNSSGSAISSGQRHSQGRKRSGATMKECSELVSSLARGAKTGPALGRTKANRPCAGHRGIPGRRALPVMPAPPVYTGGAMPGARTPTRLRRARAKRWRKTPGARTPMRGCAGRAKAWRKRWRADANAVAQARKGGENARRADANALRRRRETKNWAQALLRGRAKRWRNAGRKGRRRYRAREAKFRDANRLSLQRRGLHD